MLYICEECEYEDNRGFIPTATCGMYMILLFIFPVILVIELLRMLKAHFAIDAVGWWWLLILPVSFVISIFMAGLIAFFLEWLERTLYAKKPCPRCGARKWAGGYNRGFGL